MADKSRRKSSILKVTKTTPRAPLQDVNNLEVKSSQDDEITSHTAALRRRVSFCGKNYVKEFCAESDIASVLHAPEYEQEWHASTDSSGLVTSDNSNNTHSSTAISESHSTIHSMTHTSVLKSVGIQEDNDPSEEITREFKGAKTSKSACQAPNPSRKPRFSFGEINIPSDKVDVDEQHCQDHDSSQMKDVHKSQSFDVSTNARSVQVQESQTLVTVETRKTNYKCTNSQYQDFDAGVISSRESEVQFTESVKVTTSKVKVNLQDTQRFVHGNSQGSAKLPAINIHSVSEPEVSSLAIEDEVFAVIPTQFPTSTIADKTVFDNSGMDFTTPISGIIECGSRVLPTNSYLLSGMSRENNRCEVPNLKEGEDNAFEMGLHFVETTNKENVQNDDLGMGTNSDHPADTTLCLNDSMEFTKAIPGVIELQLLAPQMSNYSDLSHTHTVEKETIANSDPVIQACSERKINTKNTQSANQEIFHEMNQSHNVELHSKVEATNASMELIEDFPRNMHGGCNNQENWKDDYQNEKFCSLSQTQMMSTSMEFTEVLPGNIQVMYENVSSETVEAEQLAEPVSLFQTLLKSTANKFNEAVSENIQVEFQDNLEDEKPMKHEEGIPHSETQLICTSMELTKVLPGNIEVEFQGNPEENEANQLSEAAPHSQTQVMCTSMDFTEALPANIQVEVRGDCDGGDVALKEQSVTPHFQTHTVKTTNMSLGNIEAGSKTQSQNISENHVWNARESHDKSKEVHDRASNHVAMLQPGSIDFNVKCNQIKLSTQETEVMYVSERDICRRPARSIQEVLNKENPSPSENMQNLDVDMFATANVSPCMLLDVSPRFHELPSNNTIEMDGKDTTISERIECVELQGVARDSTSHSSKEPCQVDAACHTPKPEGEMLNLEESLLRSSMISEPFKSRPCLISSPIAPNVKPDQTTAEPGLISSSLARESITLHSCKSFEIIEPACIQGIVSPHPFTSKPRLRLSPPKTDTKQSRICLNGSAADAQPRNDNEESVCIISNHDNMLAAANVSPCMLLDVSPPFHEFSTNNTIEVSGNVSESGEAMLHNTIRNAEISLRQLQSPGVTEEFNRGEVDTEDMECDAAPNDQCCSEPTVSQSAILLKNIQNQSSLANTGGDGQVGADADIGTSTSSTNSSKRARDESSDREESSSAKSSSQKSAKRSRDSSWDSRENEVSSSSILSADSILHSGSAELYLDDIISEAQSKQLELWLASKCEDGFWVFKFNHMDLNLKVKLQLSLVSKGKIEAFGGNLSFNITASTNPVKIWGLKILKKRLSTNSWNSNLDHNADFMLILQKITSEVVVARRFIVDTIIQQGLHNIIITESSISFNIGSLKCHLLFQVTFQKLDSWDNYSPDDISIKNIVGDTRAVEVKNLITGVEKDAYFLRNYIRDINDYVKTLEGFCK